MMINTALLVFSCYGDRWMIEPSQPLSSEVGSPFLSPLMVWLPDAVVLLEAFYGMTQLSLLSQSISLTLLIVMLPSPSSFNDILS